MKKTLKIALPKPCEKQAWSSEFVSEREQLCLLCQEKVFDATKLSDKELHQLVTSKEKPKCIKLKQSQLNRPLEISSYQFNYKQLSGAFCSLLVASLVVSCSVQKVPKIAIADYEKSFATDPFFSDSIKYVIRGIIVDYKEHKILKNGSVALYTDIYSSNTTVDTLGRFKIEIPFSKLKDTIYLEINGRRNEVYKGFYREHYDGIFEIEKSDLPLNKVFILQEPEPIYIGAYLTEF